MQRINLDEYNLNLDELNTADTVGQLVDKINRNFRTINDVGGGPQGRRGKIGPPNCRGPRGSRGLDGENQIDEWMTKTAVNGCLNSSEEYHYHQYHYHSVEDTIDSTKLIVNKWANKSILLTNLSLNDNGLVKRRDVDDPDYSYEKVNPLFADYKLKIYNSDSDGYGRHIHLANAHAIENNLDYFCKSGFTISSDKSLLSNTEILRIIGQKNNDILGHTLKMELTLDSLSVRKTLTSQQITLDSGTGTKNVENRFVLQEQSTDNTTRIPNRTGWMGIWEDTNEENETWELIDISELVMTRIVYSNGYSSITKTYGDSNWPITLHEDSYIRFKRLNNWVLIDFRFGLSSAVPGSEFEVKSLQTKIDTGTIACRTIGWHTNTIMKNESLDDLDEESFFGFFKIDASQITSNPNPYTFVISQKFSDNYFSLVYDYHTDIFWTSGQVFATVKDVDHICDELEIEQPDQCVTDFELEQA